MLNKLKKSNQGFTIIEVMIVLAIAGLILLIVFLAVPALQRNARNTQRKSDASQLSSAIANFISNNGGSIPTAEGYVTADTTQAAVYCKGGAPSGITAGNNITFAASACTATNNNDEAAKLGYYQPDLSGSAVKTIFFTNTIGTGISTTAVGSESGTAVSTQSISVDIGYGCNSTNTGASTTPNSRAVAIIYVTEVGGGGNGNMQCIEQ